MKPPTTYTAHQVTEDLAMLVHRGSFLDESVFEELRRCPELSAQPAVQAALADVNRAIEQALRVATIETRDRVAAWLAYNMAYHLLEKLDDLLVIAGVRAESDRYRLIENAPTAFEWRAMFNEFAASGLVWEMRSCP